MKTERKSFPIHIRFNDLDLYGHVNNAAYLVYFEEGRTQLFRSRVGERWNWQKEGVLLVRNEVDYKAPLLLEDEARIEVWIAAFGNKSVEVGYRIVKKHQDSWLTCTNGKSVMVCFDYQKQATIPVPQKWKELFPEVV